MVGWAHTDCGCSDRQTQGKSRGVLIREKEPAVPSAPDTGLAELQTFSISHIYTLSLAAVG